MSGEVKHTSQVIYVTVGEGKKAYLKYSVENGVMKLLETYTPPEFRGRGIAARLLDHAIMLAEENGWEIEPICSYAVYYFMKNSGKRHILTQRYRSLSDDEWRRLFEEALSRERERSGEG